MIWEFSMDYYDKVDIDTIRVGERVEFYTKDEEGPINGIIMSVDIDFFVVKYESIPGGIVKQLQARRSYVKDSIKSIYVIGRVDTDLGL